MTLFIPLGCLLIGMKALKSSVAMPSVGEDIYALCASIFHSRNFPR